MPVVISSCTDGELFWGLAAALSPPYIPYANKKDTSEYLPKKSLPRIPLEVFRDDLNHTGIEGDHLRLPAIPLNLKRKPHIIDKPDEIISPLLRRYEYTRPLAFASSSARYSALTSCSHASAAFTAALFAFAGDISAGGVHVMKRRICFFYAPFPKQRTKL